MFSSGQYRSTEKSYKKYIYYKYPKILYYHKIELKLFMKFLSVFFFLFQSIKIIVKKRFWLRLIIKHRLKFPRAVFNFDELFNVHI